MVVKYLVFISCRAKLTDIGTFTTLGVGSRRSMIEHPPYAYHWSQKVYWPKTSWPALL